MGEAAFCQLGDMATANRSTVHDIGVASPRMSCSHQAEMAALAEPALRPYALSPVTVADTAGIVLQVRHVFGPERGGVNASHVIEINVTLGVTRAETHAIRAPLERAEIERRYPDL